MRGLCRKSPRRVCINRPPERQKQGLVEVDARPATIAPLSRAVAVLALRAARPTRPSPLHRYSRKDILIVLNQLHLNGRPPVWPAPQTLPREWIAWTWGTKLVGTLDQNLHGIAERIGRDNLEDHVGAFAEIAERIDCPGQSRADLGRLGISAGCCRKVERQEQMDRVTCRHMGRPPPTGSGREQVGVPKRSGSVPDGRSIVLRMKKPERFDQCGQSRHQLGSPSGLDTPRFPPTTPKTTATTALSRDASG